MSKRVLIVGAGPGGLATAMLLAARGANVRVLERAAGVGGRTSTLTMEGFHFDRGPTFFLYPRVLEEIFTETGHDLHREVPMKRLEPMYRVLFEQGGHLDATADMDALTAAVAQLAPADAGHVQAYMEDNRRKFERFAPCLSTPFLSWWDIFTRRMIGLVPVLKPGQSLDGYLAGFFKDERVRLAFSFQSKYLGMSPFKCPSIFSILSFIEYAFGLYHPIGGCAALTTGMARVAREMGVRIDTGAPVERIVFEGRRAAGVRVAGERIDGDAVVVNADFARAMTTLVPEALRPRWTDAKIARKQFSCSTFMLYLGIEGRYEHLRHHNIFLANDYRKNLAEIDTLYRLPENPSLYVQNAGLTDETLAPPGCSTLYVLVPVPHQHVNVDWSQERGRYRALVMKQLEKLGLEGLEQRIRVERVVAPADWDAQGHIHLGATFNLKHTYRQMLHLRPHNRFEDVERMYLVGGGTHPGSGLPVIFESARITARLMEEDMGLGKLSH